ncbi:MAG: hypothetical protein AAF570_27830, partial [Bacteroidota bacterium]
MKINGNNGAILWHRIFNDGIFEHFSSVHEFANNQFVAVGKRSTEIILLGFNQNGDTLWTKELPGNLSSLGTAVVGNKTYSAGGNVASGDALLYRTTYNGTLNCPTRENTTNGTWIASTATPYLINPVVTNTNSDLTVWANTSVSNYTGLTMANNCTPSGPQNCAAYVRDSTIACADVPTSGLFCVPIQVDTTIPANVLGASFDLTFNPQQIQPTGGATTAGTISQTNFLPAPDTVRVALYSNGQGAFPTNGELLCMDFQLQSTYVPGTPIVIGLHNLEFFQAANSFSVTTCPGTWQIVNDTTLDAKIIYQGMNAFPIQYDSL